MSSTARHTTRFAIWGTFDTGKPRVRVLLDAARQIDPGLAVCHRSPWGNIEDKSQIKGFRRRIGIAWRWLLCYPALIFAYLRIPPHKVVIVPYLGNLDVLILWPFARLRGAKICWDMFISLYDTVVIDRRLLGRTSIPARLLLGFEWLSVRAADRVLMDTEIHARYIAGLYHAAPGKVRSVWVGTEDTLFRRAPGEPASGPIRVLFYGQFIPLHGLMTLIEAIAIITHDTAAPAMRFSIIGSGQEAARIDAAIAANGLDTVQRLAWLNYAELPARIADADICLGIFAAEGKASRVIPNKVFQILAVGRPLITRDSPAIREIVQPGPAIRLVQPENPQDLAAALIALARALHDPAQAKAIHLSAQSDMPIANADTIRDQLIRTTEFT